jgi:hypothetical protein
MEKRLFKLSRLYRQKSYTQLWEFLETNPIRKHPVAMEIEGVMHYRGFNTRKSPKKAMEVWEKARKKRSSKALVLLGAALLKSNLPENKQRGFEYLLKARKKNKNIKFKSSALCE